MQQFNNTVLTYDEAKRAGRIMRKLLADAIRGIRDFECRNGPIVSKASRFMMCPAIAWLKGYIPMGAIAEYNVRFKRWERLYIGETLILLDFKRETLIWKQQ